MKKTAFLEESAQKQCVALVGNPNVGKSTVFNGLTGLHQHTGNWPGKTVALACGRLLYGAREALLVDLPGTYSLQSHSQEETVTEQFLRSGRPNCVVAVCDATCLERNLYLVLQVLQITGNVLLCVNLLDEAARRGIRVDLQKLSAVLGIPVVGCAAGKKQGIAQLRAEIGAQIARAEALPPRPACCPVALVQRAEAIAKTVVSRDTYTKKPAGARLDALLMHPLGGAAFLFLLLFAIFYLTIRGANVPTALLEAGFGRIQAVLSAWCAAWPPFLRGILLDGVLETVCRVISVMLPPMAIFFPLFTLLEDWGVLPRVAFLLDRPFECCGACGKQGLCMCMGLGCNAVGVSGCRIIDSPRDRRIAMVTNAFMPCNGRFPAMIALITIFFSGQSKALAALMLAGIVLLGVLLTFLCSALLSKTLLRGTPGSFTLEIPPYRSANVGRILVRSLLDRTAFVLGRAVLVAAPAGAVIWLLGNVHGGSLLRLCAGALAPLGNWMGLDGVILLSFILALPANELVLPVLLMQLSGSATLLQSEASLAVLLRAAGWTPKTALCTLLFFLLHWPCSTTLLTIRRESGRWSDVLLAFCLPTIAGILLCGLSAALLR